MTHIDRYTCEDLFRLLDDYLDDRLSEEQVQLVLAHLGICAVCATEYKFEASVLEQVRAKVSRGTPPEGLMKSISARLRAEQAPDSDPKDSGSEGTGSTQH